jgi:hypothetical protein
MIINQIEAAMSKLLDETGLECTCITLHPEHHTQLINEFKNMVNVDPAIEEPIWYRGIPVYKAELADYFGASNPLLEERYSMVGYYDFDLDQYIAEQHFAIDNQ